MLYSKIDLSYLESDAEVFVLENDRMLYKPFFDAAEEFCAKNNMIIGGRAGIDFLLSRHKTKDSFMWEIYTDDAFNRAKQLAVMLSNVHSPHVSNRTIALQTNIKHQEFTLMINTRQSFKIYSLDTYRGVKLTDFIRFDNCLSPEMQLINIYHILYTPAKNASWEENYAIEDSVFSKIAREKILTGGDETSGETDTPPTTKLLKLGIVIGSEYYLTGKTQRVQLLSAEPIDDICKKAGQMIKSKVSPVKFHLNLPTDFQLTKHTIYDDRKNPVADVFNAPEFEMIPFSNINGIKRANPWVVLRFLFIDIWILRLITKISGKSNAGRINKLLDAADKIRSEIRENPSKTFQSRDYDGIYIDENVAKKKLIKEIGTKFPIFYPAKMNEVTGGSESTLSTSAIDLAIDPNTKKAILRKITGRVNNDILSVLKWFSKSKPSAWGINKTVEKFPLSNAKFLPYIPQTIDTYIDVGCGSGADMAAMKSTHSIKRAICVDVNDFREASTDTEFIIAANPLPIGTASVDLITVFHTLHHMNDSIAQHIADFSRMLKPGGLLLIKDHDVNDATQASNVDFEHFVYMIPGVKNIHELMENFPQHEPMTYYSADSISRMVLAAGFEIIHRDVISPRTYVYALVAKKM